MDYSVSDINRCKGENFSGSKSRISGNKDGRFDLDVALRFGEGFDLGFREVDFPRRVFREELDLVPEGFFEPAPAFVREVCNASKNCKAAISSRSRYRFIVGDRACNSDDIAQCAADDRVCNLSTFAINAGLVFTSVLIQVPVYSLL